MQEAVEVVDAYFLEVRCQLLEIAASLDRIDRAEQRAGERLRDPRLERIYASLELLADRRASADRAERLLNLFSD